MLTDVAARNIVSVLLNDVLDRPQANAINLSAEHRFCFTIESDRILGNFKRFELCNRLWCCRTKVDLSLLFQDGNEFCQSAMRGSLSEQTGHPTCRLHFRSCEIRLS